MDSNSLSFDPPHLHSVSVSDVPESELPLVQIGPQLDGRRRNGDISHLNRGRGRPRKEEVQTQASPAEWMAELLRGLGGYKRAMRMYARAIRKAPPGKQVDALFDVFKLGTKEVGDKLTEESVAALSDEDLAKLTKKVLTQ